MFIRLGGLCGFFLGAYMSFRKAAMEFVGYGRGDPFCYSTWNQTPRFLFATRSREEPKHQQQHEYTMGGHTCRNIADLACFNYWPLGDRDIQGQGNMAME